MIQKQCLFCAECLKNYPEEVALTIYPPGMAKCPRCLTKEFTEIESDCWPRYFGSPEPPKKKPQRTMF